MTVVGYHTLEDRGDIDYVEQNGPFECLRGNAWLGKGYYFWDSNIDWAHQWGKNSYENYIICSADIDINENCFDLKGNVNHEIELKNIISWLKQNGLLNDNDDIYLRKLIELLKRKKIFRYKAIRASDNNKPIYKIKFAENRREEFSLLDRTQICLIDKTNLNSGSFRVIYPENQL